MRDRTNRSSTNQTGHGVLPPWAPHRLLGSAAADAARARALGRDRAVVFGYPLLSPPSETRANKILWVSRRPIKPPDRLRIRAQRMRGDRPVGQQLDR